MSHKNNLFSFEGFYLSVIIETPHYLSEYVEYPVRLSYSPNETVTGDSYLIVKRYSDFDHLKKAIKQTHLPVQLPPKKLFGKFDMSLVNERKVMLEQFLKSIISIPLICKSLPVTNFFQKDSDNITDYSKIAMQQISLDFRCETNWQVGKLLPEIGCRTKKQFVSMTNISDQKKYLLGWAEFGPEYSPLNFKSFHKLLKTLPSIKHDFIYPIIFTTDNENSVSVIRPFCEIGSLHDFMLKVRPTNSICVKYAYQAASPTLVNEISLFGRQILIGLNYLHDKGWPYGHLHIRNVMMITEQKCTLTDIENSLLGLVPQDRHFYVGILKKMTFEEIDIYCFGRLIFHMVFGYSLEKTFIDNDDQLRWPSPTIREFLFSILTENVLQNGFPKIDAMLESTLFKSFSNRPIEKGSYKLSDSCKEYLQTTHQHSLKLLIVDQKLVKSQRRKKLADAMETKKKQQRKDEVRRTKSTLTKSDYGDLANVDEQHSSNSTITSPLPSSAVTKKIDKNNNVTQPSSSIPAPPPPPPPPPPAGVPPNHTVTNVAASSDPGHSQLLNLISGFNKGNLRKAKTIDKSSPRL